MTETGQFSGGPAIKCATRFSLGTREAGPSGSVGSSGTKPFNLNYKCESADVRRKGALHE